MLANGLLTQSASRGQVFQTFRRCTVCPAAGQDGEESQDAF